MRSVRFPLLVLASLLAVVLGVGAAFVGTRDKGEPGQSAATAPTTSAPATQDAAVETGGSAKGATTSNGGGGTSAGGAAKAAAAVFMRDLGMRDPVAATYRATGDVTAEVGIHPRAGEIGRPLDKVTTLVQLRRYTGGWVVTGARASNAIEVAEPLAFARVLSPLTVSGLSNAYEGTVHVTVTEDRRGADRVLGKGFSGDTGADTGIMSATAVRIRFGAATAAPRIRGVRTTPAPIGSANVVMLTGSGTLTVRVDAINARDVRFLLVPSGTGNRPNAKLLGVDSDGGNGWTLSWRYQDESFMGHLLVQVNGSGGTAGHDRIGVQHA
jgi:hypothetical protein